MQTRSKLAAINANDTGTVITNFFPDPNGDVRSIAIKDDSLIYIGGTFTKLPSTNSVTFYNRAGVVKNSDGSPYPWFPDLNYLPATGTVIVNKVLNATSAILSGGLFTGATNWPQSFLSGFNGTCISTFLTSNVVNPICAGDSIQLFATGATAYTWSPPLNIDNTTSSNPIVWPDTTTYYTVTGTALGCTNFATVTVTVNQPPQVPAITPAGTSTICPGDSILLTTTPTSNTLYGWSNGDTLNYTLVGGTGYYYLTVTNIAGCSQTSDSVLITVLPSPPVPLVTYSNHWLNTTCGMLGYQWYYSSSLTGTFAPIAFGDSCAYNCSAAGYYFVDVTDASTCSNRSDTTFYLCEGIANVNQNSMLGTFEAFPNPFTSETNITVMVHQSTEISIAVYDLLGSKIATLAESKRINAGENYTYTLDVKDAGVYFVQMKYGNGKTSVKRIIKN